MGYVVERPDSYLSRIVEGLSDVDATREGLAHDLAHVHVEGWRQAYGSLLPERFYDDDARAARVRLWTALLADDQAQDRVRIATTGTGAATTGPADTTPGTGDTTSITGDTTPGPGDNTPGAGDAATDPGGVVGFSIHGPARDEDRAGLELFSLYVLAEHYGTGVAPRLIDAAIGANPACLWVAAENPRAIRFYEKNGFQPDGTRKSDPDVDGLEEIRMVRGQ